MCIYIYIYLHIYTYLIVLPHMRLIWRLESGSAHCWRDHRSAPCVHGCLAYHVLFSHRYDITSCHIKWYHIRWHYMSLHSISHRMLGRQRAGPSPRRFQEIHHLYSWTYHMICSAIIDMGPGPGPKAQGANVPGMLLGPLARVPRPYLLWLNICASRAITRQSIGNSKGPRRDQ